jgi:hypothetical protein
MYTNFEQDIEKGKIREFIFKHYFCGFLNIRSKDVTGDAGYRQKDIDLITTDFTVDVKTLTFKDGIIIEDYTNINEGLGVISKGWFYKSAADLIAFVYYNRHNSDDKQNGLIVILRFSNEFKEWYLANMERYQLRQNKITNGKNGKQWQSAYRVIPFDDLSTFIASFKVKITKEHDILTIAYPEKTLT